MKFSIGLLAAWIGVGTVAALGTGEVAAMAFPGVVLPGAAQDVASRLKVYLTSDDVGLGEVVQIVVSVKDAADARMLDLPRVDGLEIGTPTGPTVLHSISTFNGRKRKSSEVRYGIPVRALRAGEYTLPAFTVELEGERVSTPELSLTVVQDARGEGPDLPRIAGSSSRGPNGTSVERPGDGRPTCGLGKDFHAGRRAALRAKLGEGLIVLRGLEETRDYTRFHQDKVFWYLTGIDSPGAALVMDAKTGAETLYLPKPNARGEMWEGEKWDCADAWVSELTGLKEIRCGEALLEDLEQQIDKGERVWVSLHPAIALSACFDRAQPFDRHIEKDPLDGRLSREKALAANLERLYGADVQDLSATLAELRLIKQPPEIEAMRHAGRAGALAMLEAMRSTRAGVGEWELEALMSWVQIRHGATGPGYHGIVGSGPNSLVLHYSTSRRALQSGEVILIDYAPEVDHFVSDITRTWPVDGAFTARQAELYDAVLASQMAGIAAVKPGKTIAEIQKVCRDVLVEKGFGDFIRHGSCHWIGMEVHDVGDYDTPLAPGMSFTVEPGLYEPATGIGIRIEDVVLVTPEGCEVLSALVPKSRAEIERLIPAEGVLDWLDRPEAD